MRQPGYIVDLQGQQPQLAGRCQQRPHPGQGNHSIHILVVIVLIVSYLRRCQAQAELLQLPQMLHRLRIEAFAVVSHVDGVDIIIIKIIII